MVMRMMDGNGSLNWEALLQKSLIVWGSFVKRHIAIEEAYILQTLHAGIGDAAFFTTYEPYRIYKCDMCVTWNFHLWDMTHSYV